MNNTIYDEVLDILKRFQFGYSERSLSQADAFVTDLFHDDDDVIIIGTGSGEFCKGINEIKELVKIDWEYWGNFKLDLDKAIISNCGEVSWVVCDGVLNKSKKPEVIFDGCKNRIEKTLSSNEPINDKLVKTLKLISYSLHECNIGDEIGRPVRFTAILKKGDDQWKFSNIHFSYPVAPPTDIKIL